MGQVGSWAQWGREDTWALGPPVDCIPASRGGRFGVFAVGGVGRGDVCLWGAFGRGRGRPWAESSLASRWARLRARLGPVGRCGRPPVSPRKGCPSDLSSFLGERNASLPRWLTRHPWPPVWTDAWRFPGGDRPSHPPLQVTRGARAEGGPPPCRACAGGGSGDPRDTDLPPCLLVFSAQKERCWGQPVPTGQVLSSRRPSCFRNSLSAPLTFGLFGIKTRGDRNRSRAFRGLWNHQEAWFCDVSCPVSKS